MTIRKHATSKLVITTNDKDRLVTVTINEKPHQVERCTNLQQIIIQFSLSEVGCVFAINNQVVPRSEWESTVLSEGDSISLFQAIAGG